MIYREEFDLFLLKSDENYLSLMCLFTIDVVNEGSC